MEFKILKLAARLSLELFILILHFNYSVNKKSGN